VIKLKDACAGYENPRKPRSVIWTGQAPIQRYCVEIHSLTVDTGTNNSGACGVMFIANNQGGVYDVTICSGDGQGIQPVEAKRLSVVAGVGFEPTTFRL